MKSAGKARNNGLYRHIRTSKEIIRNLLNDSFENIYVSLLKGLTPYMCAGRAFSFTGSENFSKNFAAAAAQLPRPSHILP